MQRRIGADEQLITLTEAAKLLPEVDGGAVRVVFGLVLLPKRRSTKPTGRGSGYMHRPRQIATWAIRAG